MSHLPPSPLRVQFYLSAPAPCPYLTDQTERKIFTHLPHDPELDPEINSALTGLGFRRSHDIVYRPACPTCNACIPVRIPVHAFAPSRTQRRIKKLNCGLVATHSPNDAHKEDYELFIAYQRSRHNDGEMAAMTWHDYQNMIEACSPDSFLYRLRNRTGELMCVVFCDRVTDGVSAIYSFFNPTHPSLSLGVMAILSLIDETRNLGLPYLYLGYWIAKSQKMAYKSRFHPLEALTSHGWEQLNSKRNDDTTHDTIGDNFPNPSGQTDL